MMLPFIFSAWMVRNGAEEEKDLLWKVANRDAKALERLYNRYSKLLYSIILAILKHTEESQDLLQEVFVQIWHKAPTFDVERGNAYVWLVSMTRNRAIDVLRSRRFRDQQLEDKPEDWDVFGAFNYPTPLDAVVVREQEDLLRCAFAQISPEQQAVLQLAYHDGLSQSEIAAELSIPLGTVKTRMRQGMIKLHSLVKRLM